MSPQGTKLYYYANSAKRNCVVLPSNMAAVSHGCKRTLSSLQAGLVKTGFDPVHDPRAIALHVRCSQASWELVNTEFSIPKKVNKMISEYITQLNHAVDVT